MKTKTIILEFLVSLIIFNIVNIFIHIIFKEIANIEFFSYNFFGSIIVYLICFILDYIFCRVIPSVKNSIFIDTLFLLIFLEIAFFLISGVSLSYTIIRIAVPEKNYIMFFYPLCIILVKFFFFFKDKMIKA